MLRVGLTGGIACGKSYALHQFRRLGAYTIDADEIAHRVIRPGEAAFEDLVREFGPNILAPDQSIDRRELGRIVFADLEARERLNRILHPIILREESRLLEECAARPSRIRLPIAIVDAALMIETGSYRRYDFLIVVYCHPAIQLARLITRDGISEEEALQRIRSQMPILEKVRYADFVIENSGKMSDTNHQIHQTYTELLSRYEEDQN